MLSIIGSRVHSENAEDPMEFTLFGMLIEDKFRHLQKALLPMSVMPFSIVTDFSAQLEKA